MNEILRYLVESEGYCCILGMLENSKSMRTAELVKLWGVSRGTIKYWKRKLRQGERCPHHSSRSPILR